jgi:hypothetical protein
MRAPVHTVITRKFPVFLGRSVRHWLILLDGSTVETFLPQAFHRLRCLTRVNRYRNGLSALGPLFHTHNGRRTDIAGCLKRARRRHQHVSPIDVELQKERPPAAVSPESDQSVMPSGKPAGRRCAARPRPTKLASPRPAEREPAGLIASCSGGLRCSDPIKHGTLASFQYAGEIGWHLSI